MIFEKFLGRATRPVRVVFSGHDFKFLAPFIERCQQNPALYEVRLDKHKGHQIDSEEEARKHVEWADIIFCEWALGNAVWYSRHKREDQLLVVRLHHQEVHARDRIKFIWEIDWSRVDKLVLISKHVYDWMLGEFPILRDRACLIYNPIDAQGALNVAKPEGAQFNLGLVGIVPQPKRLDLAIDLLEILVRQDPRYKLHIKGKRPEEFSWMLSRHDEMAWYQQVYARIEKLPFADAVVFHPHGSDMAEWYAQMGFILSTSDFEGSHQAVAEGMAAGCIPVIRNWKGSDQIYPSKYIVTTMEEGARAIRKWSDGERMPQEIDSCRRFARERFDQRMICDKLESFFVQFIERRFPKLAQRQASPKVCATLPPVMLMGYVPPGYRGGYRIRIEQEIKALLRLGCRVHFACLHPEAVESSALEAHCATLRELGCSVHPIKSAGFFNAQITAESMREEIEAIGELAKSLGVRLIHAEALYSARLAVLLKERYPELKVVFDSHGISPEEERMGGSHPNRVAAMEGWERRVLQAADLNVFVSEAMGGHYREKYGLANLPHVTVPCCVADERFPAATAAPAELPAGRTIAAYLGTMAAWQCGPEMIALFAQLHRRNPSLFFMLLVPRGDHQKTRELMEQAGLPAGDVLLTELAHEQVAGTLQHAHAAFLLRADDPVNRVSSPTKFGEYLAAGVPVVMTGGIGDFSQMAVQEKVGHVLESALLKEAELPEGEVGRLLEFLEASRTGHAEIAARCRECAREQLHWEPASERLARAYTEILTGD